jgi:Zn-dependent protease with chaperone function
MNIAATRFTTKARTWLLIAGLTGLLIAIGGVIGGGALYLFVALAVLMNVAGYWFSDKLALKASRAQLYPMKEAPNSYEFKVVLPFSGLGMQNGSKVQMTVIMPITAQIDTNATKGVAINGVEVNELIKPMENVNRNILSFEYHQDPLFTIRYMY